MPGGRCGCRSIEEALALAEAIVSPAHVELGDVETYENVSTTHRETRPLVASDTRVVAGLVPP
jgi:D-serine deaminase-like pyridoxal phosphate-dependent protein